MRDMDALMTDTMEEAEQRIAKSVNGITGIPTGLTDLNRMTSGLQNGELIAIAARPSVGKTAFALHLARQAAMQKHAVAVYSLEMQGERLADRWLLSASDINPYRWRTGIPNPHEVAEAHTTAAELARLPIHVDDSTSISMDHVRSSARLLKSKSACDLIIIDYLQLCDMNTGQKNRTERSRRIALPAKPRVGRPSRWPAGTIPSTRKRRHRARRGCSDAALPPCTGTAHYRPGKRLSDRRTGGSHRSQTTQWRDRERILQPQSFSHENYGLYTTIGSITETSKIKTESKQYYIT